MDSIVDPARGRPRRPTAVASLGLTLLLGLLALTPGTVSADALPEGYAYEMISPLHTQGQPVGAGPVRPDGDQLLLSSVGGFAGTPNSGQTSVNYLATRHDAGWETTPIAPPASDYAVEAVSGGLMDVTEDLRRTLWVANAVPDIGTYRFTTYLRETDGGISAAGPVMDGALPSPGATVVGTSRDLGSVVLSGRSRPALTDGTEDTRATTRESLIVSTRGEDGTLEIRQVAYSGGVTMLPTCPLVLGGTGTTSRGSVSDDASRIFFSTTGTIPTACRAPAARRVWARVGTADAFDLSASQCTVDCGTPQIALFEGASRDGSRVYFTTEQKLVDGDQDTTVGTKSDLYEYDFDDPGNELKPVTIGSEATGAGVMRVARVSDDGSRVYFVANGRPLAGANARGAVPQLGASNLYVYHRADGQGSGTIGFVGTLAAADSPLWDTGISARPVQMSYDGRFVIFPSRADLTSDRLAGDAQRDIFRYDAQTDDLRRVWTDDPAHNGAARSAGSLLLGPAGDSTYGARQTRWGAPTQMSADARMVVFDTEERLSDEDVNNHVDAYLWQAETGKLSMLTSGRSRMAASVARIMPSGDSIFVTSSEPLVKAHTSGSAALYAIRRGGGFPDLPAPPGPCSGEDCQGVASPPPVLPVIGSIGFVGNGNVPFLPDPVRASVRVSKLKAVSGSAARLKVRVPGAGRISVAGSSIRRAKKSASRAGNYSVRVTLSSRAKKSLRKQKALTVSVRVSYRAQDGTSASKLVSITFKRPKAGRAKTKVRAAGNLTVNTKGSN